MSSTTTPCPDILMTGNCTKGEDCFYCKPRLEINFNVNAKVFVPKSKTIQNENNEVDLNNFANKLSFNLGASEYIPKLMQSEGVEDVEAEEDEDSLEEDEYDQILKDIIMEEIEDDDESDDEKWFPKYKDCECCKGFVYKCTGVACVNMGTCYCKMKEECDEEES